MRPDSSVQWSAYPALLLAGAFAFGIAVDASLNPPTLCVWFGLGFVGTMLFVGLEWWTRVKMVTPAPFGRVVAALLIGVAAGGARYAVYDGPPARSLASVAQTSEDDLSVRGTIIDAPERSKDATRFTLAVDTIVGSETGAPIQGKARVTLRPSPWTRETVQFPAVQEGDVLRLTGLLRRPPGLRNPGGFDYRAYLQRRGICCTLYVDDPDDVRISGSRRSTVEMGVVFARKYVRTQIQRYVATPDARAVLGALLLGDRSQITDEQRDRFVKTGLMHLLAVSGLHVFLVGMVFYLLLRPLLGRAHLGWQTAEISRAALTVALLGFYMLVTGGRPSVVRAVIMASLLIGGILFQRSAHPLNTLGIAALVLLGLRPGALFDVGFQLSMAAVTGIVVLNGRLLDAVPEHVQDSEPVDWVVQTVTTSAAAILSTAPVLLYHFGWVSASGLVLNTVGIPCTALALGAAFLMVATGGLWTTAGVAFGSASDLFVRGLLATSQYGAEWLSWAGIRMPIPDLWVIGALGAALVAVAQWPRPRHRWGWVAVVLILACGSVWTNVFSRSAPPTLNAVFFDVGQGDAALFSTPGDRHLLVDTGPRSPTGSAAEFVILPYLERHGIDHIETIAITHPDEDHLGGLPALLREVSVGRIVRSGQSAETELFAEVRRLLGVNGVSTRVVQRGDTLAVHPSLRVQILSPPRRPLLRGIESRNGMSVVAHVAYGGVDFLLPGDVEAAAEQDLVRTYQSQLGSHVVKVPHHGSSTSSTNDFVGAVTVPEKIGRAVVSVGRQNRYGMPSDEVLSRWKRGDMHVHVTADEGAIWLQSDGGRLWLEEWR